MRHEVTHALLHASVSNLPLWLDEGLAEYFEVEDKGRGVNPDHLDRLAADLKGGWKPDLPRLEGLTDVRQMSARDYREAWGWVHYFLRGEPRDRSELLSYLADLRSEQEARPLSKRLHFDSSEAGTQLLAHVDKLHEAPIAAGPSPRTLVVRGQDAPLDAPLKAAPRRRSVVSRMIDWLGF